MSDRWMSEPARRVERGAKILDEKHPGWPRLIKTDSLRVDSFFDCVLGQLFGNYTFGKEAIGVKLGRDYGFDLNHDDSYSELRELWTNEINQRLTGGQS